MPKLTEKALKILGTLAYFRERRGLDAVPKKKLAQYSDHKLNSTFHNRLTPLKNDGYITFVSGDVSITEKGFEVAPEVEPIAPTNEKAQEQFKSKLKKMAVRIFDHLTDGREYGKKELAETLKVAYNSTFHNAMTQLIKEGAAVYPTKGSVKLTEDCFPEGRP